MKTNSILSLLLVLSICSYSQNYQISFTGTGASTSVDNVQVENLTQGTSLTLSGADVLNLRAVLTTDIAENEQSSEDYLKVFPNPVTDYAGIQFLVSDPGDVLITVYDQLGKLLIQTGDYHNSGTYTYQLVGLQSGIYIINVTGTAFSYSAKVISKVNGGGHVNIIALNLMKDTELAASKRVNKLKSANSVIQMQYNSGDRLKITGYSGDYATVYIEIPTADKTITFDFIACSDGDDINYPIVKIGPQIWMAENLKTSKLKDGGAIDNVTGNGDWEGLSTPAYCLYDNNTANKDVYGALYNYYAVNTDKLCPAGWVVPSDGDWEDLVTYLGGDTVAGAKLKEAGTTYWNSPNTGATNESGFSVRGGGYRGVNGTFGSFGVCDFLWSNTAQDADHFYYRYFASTINSVNKGPDVKTVGFSVRCIKETTGTVTDIDGNVYHTITIGTQTWMVENLRTTKYNDGNDIPMISDCDTWSAMTTPAYCWYSNDSIVNSVTYGALYNWYAVNTGKLCPAGWHVPTESDWNTLIAYLGGDEVAGGKLKETGIGHWLDPNAGATNETGFTALPAGSRWDFCFFNFLTYDCFWWSASQYDNDNAYYRQIEFTYPDMYSGSTYKHCGLSVRCVKN